MDILKSESIHKELDKLEAISEIIGAALVNRNGLLISSRLPRDVDDRKFGAMAATMFIAIETSALTLGKKTVSNLTVEYSEFQLVVLGVNKSMILVSLLKYNSNLGLIFIEIEESIKKIKKILSG
ncbi:MAG: roadblock/LC7 domain-containing protein [Promethearchaeota archaeon]|jgi:predicted regulator of Ras-like GTPase activity (Roadblock/LC7/MglB family)